MPDRELATERRGLSEASGVAILIGITVVVTATVGLSAILDVGETGPPRANFSYSYIEQNNMLIVTHQRGDPLPAGSVILSGEKNNVTWATIAGMNDTEMVSQGDTIQLSENNAFNQSLLRQDRVRIYYESNGNRTELSRWSG
ncbi:MAG: type IV pilin N-terminal domain-containing protein [Haloarculaceae archaeon]